MTPEQKQAVRALLEEVLGGYAEDAYCFNSIEDVDARMAAYRARLEALLAEVPQERGRGE